MRWNNFLIPGYPHNSCPGWTSAAEAMLPGTGLRWTEDCPTAQLQKGGVNHRLDPAQQHRTPKWIGEVDSTPWLDIAPGKTHIDIWAADSHAQRERERERWADTIRVSTAS